MMSGVTVNVVNASAGRKSGNRHVNNDNSRPRNRAIPCSSACIPKIRFWTILAKCNLPLQLDSISKESLQYFQPYRENHYPTHLQKILRTGNFTNHLRQECTKSELRLHNQCGETLMHVLCQSRWFPGIIEIVRWLLDEVDLPLNVRDCHGRSPLHVACMVTSSSGYLFDDCVQESFALVRFLIGRAPELLLFEDNYGYAPLDLVAFRDFPEWNDILETSLSDTPSCVSRIRQALSPPFEVLGMTPS